MEQQIQKGDYVTFKSPIKGYNPKLSTEGIFYVKDLQDELALLINTTDNSIVHGNIDINKLDFYSRNISLSSH